MAKYLFEQSMCSLWNIKCGNVEYVYRSSHEYSPGCNISGWSNSGTPMALIKKYQKKLAKVTKLIEIITLALAMFETSVSKVLKDGKIDEQEFAMLQGYTTNRLIICPMLITR